MFGPEIVTGAPGATATTPLSRTEEMSMSAGVYGAGGVSVPATHWPSDFRFSEFGLNEKPIATVLGGGGTPMMLTVPEPELGTRTICEPVGLTATSEGAWPTGIVATSVSVTTGPGSVLLAACELVLMIW